MSDLSAAAAAMGVPEEIVERSARARADATSQSYEEVVAAWAGGEAVASPTPAPEPPDERPAPTETDESPAPDSPDVAQPTPPAPSPPADVAPPPSAPLLPPILDSLPDRPLVIVLGGLGVVVLVVLLGFVFPSLPEAGAEVRSSQVVLSDSAQAGRDVYLRAGCASCHTQVVRSVVADVGLGAVSLADTNQVIGYRRVGPDLSDVGSRLTSEQISSVIAGPTHPPLVLSAASTSALVSYLSESATSPAGAVGTGQPEDGSDDESEPDDAEEGAEP